MEFPPLQLRLLLPLVGCLAGALSALAIMLHDPRERSNQIATLLLAGGAWWGFCQLLWTAAPNPSTAYFWHHAAAPGWAFIGPLAVHLIAQHTDPPAWMRRVIAPAYAVGGVFMLLQLTTSWMHGDAMRTALGWGFEARSGHVWYLVFTFACVIPAIGFALHRVRSAPSPAQRGQIALVGIGIATPFLLAGLTGGILPVFGIQVPRMGSISFGFLGITIAWSYYRYGFSALAPGHFSREILATLPNGLAFMSLDGRVLSGNERMAALLSVEMSELVGFPIEDALTTSLTSPPRELREHECQLTPPGGDDVVVSVSTSLLLDKQDRPIGIVLVVRDLRELVELRNHLVTSGRLAAVGELAAGIAHEINNPIAFVRANLSQLQHDWRDIAKRLPEGEARADDGVDLVAEGEELLEECIDGVERTVRIVQDVKGFARAGSDDHEPVDLNDLLARMLRVAQPQIPYDVRVESRYGEIPKVMGAEPHLQQVFLNLVLNAYQAIEGGGKVLVETRVEDGAVLVAVSDDGAGIDPADIQRIFDPFFTTKPVGEGTGLGLAISFQIVQSHDGKISVTSEPGVGTTFQVRLPIPA
jgi:signal transduction histidine kinase